MSCDPHLLMPKTLFASAALLIALFSAVPCTAGGTSERDLALLLGHESMALFYNDIGQPLDGRTSIDLRLDISDHLSQLGLLDVSYPTNPIGTREDPAALSSYGQTVIDALDEVESAAFMVGWYGAIMLAGQDRSFPASIVCEFAPLADFENDSDCDTDPNAYLRTLLEQARSSTQ